MIKTNCFMLCKQLEDSGYVTAEFEKSVLEHEVTAPTALGKGVAIPHGNAKCYKGLQLWLPH